MTTELEEQFFKTFGIEKECVRGCGEYYFENGNIDAWTVFDCKNSDCSKCEHDKSIWKYPEITDRKLLKMICIYAQREVFCFPVVLSNEETWTVSLIKENIIKQLMYLGKYSDDKEIVKHQIQQLFEEEE